MNTYDYGCGGPGHTLATVCTQFPPCGGGGYGQEAGFPHTAGPTLCTLPPMCHEPQTNMPGCGYTETWGQCHPGNTAATVCTQFPPCGGHGGYADAAGAGYGDPYGGAADQYGGGYGDPFGGGGYGDPYGGGGGGYGDPFGGGGGYGDPYGAGGGGHLLSMPPCPSVGPPCTQPPMCPPPLLSMPPCPSVAPPCGGGGGEQAAFGGQAGGGFEAMAAPQMHITLLTQPVWQCWTRTRIEPWCPPRITRYPRLCPRPTIFEPHCFQVDPRTIFDPTIVQQPGVLQQPGFAAGGGGPAAFGGGGEQGFEAMAQPQMHHITLQTYPIQQCIQPTRQPWCPRPSVVQICVSSPIICRTSPAICRTSPIICRTSPIICRTQIRALCEPWREQQTIFDPTIVQQGFEQPGGVGPMGFGAAGGTEAAAAGPIGGVTAVPISQLNVCTTRVGECVSQAIRCITVPLPCPIRTLSQWECLRTLQPPCPTSLPLTCRTRVPRLCITQSPIACPTRYPHLCPTIGTPNCPSLGIACTQLQCGGGFEGGGFDPTGGGQW